MRGAIGGAVCARIIGGIIGGPPGGRPRAALAGAIVVRLLEVENVAKLGSDGIYIDDLVVCYYYGIHNAHQFDRRERRTRRR